MSLMMLKKLQDVDHERKDLRTHAASAFRSERATGSSVAACAALRRPWPVPAAPLRAAHPPHGLGEDINRTLLHCAHRGGNVAMGVTKITGKGSLDRLSASCNSRPLGLDICRSSTTQPAASQQSPLRNSSAEPNVSTW